MHQLHAWRTQRSEEGRRSPGTVVKNACEPSYRSWELNLGSLQEQKVGEPSPQFPLAQSFKKVKNIFGKKTQPSKPSFSYVRTQLPAFPLLQVCLVFMG